MRLWEKVVALRYKNTTDVITKGLEKLLVDTIGIQMHPMRYKN